MKTLLLPLLFLLGCAQVRTDGGQNSFDVATYRALGADERPTYAQTVVRREERDPEGMTIQRLRAAPQGRLKRLALVLLESEVQVTRSGLAASGSNVYLSPRGKQMIAEEVWSAWDRRLREESAAMGVEWLERKALLRSPAFRRYGKIEPDLILDPRLPLGSGDVFWKNGGEKLGMESFMLPARYQDVSILFIPAGEMLIGTKAVEHQKHWVNDLCRELKLDAVLVVGHQASWTAGGKDKRSGEEIPEEMRVAQQAVLLYPFTTYQEVGRDLGKRELPKKSIPLASYSAQVKFPVRVSVPETERTFTTIQDNVLAPLRAANEGMADLMVQRILADLPAPVER